MATPLPDVNAYGQALVPIVFDCFNFPSSYGNILSEAIGDVGFTGGGAKLLCLAQHILRDFLQGSGRIGEARRRFCDISHGQ